LLKLLLNLNINNYYKIIIHSFFSFMVRWPLFESIMNVFLTCNGQQTW